MGYEIEDRRGKTWRCALLARGTRHPGQLTAVAPAVLAARAIGEGRFAHRGLVPPDRHVDPAELFDFLANNGIEFHGVTEIA